MKTTLFTIYCLTLIAGSYSTPIIIKPKTTSPSTIAKETSPNILPNNAGDSINFQSPPVNQNAINPLIVQTGSGQPFNYNMLQTHLIGMMNNFSPENSQTVYEYNFEQPGDQQVIYWQIKNNKPVNVYHQWSSGYERPIMDDTQIFIQHHDGYDHTNVHFSDFEKDIVSSILGTP